MESAHTPLSRLSRRVVAPFGTPTSRVGAVAAGALAAAVLVACGPRHSTPATTSASPTSAVPTSSLPTSEPTSVPLTSPPSTAPPTSAGTVPSTGSGPSTLPSTTLDPAGTRAAIAAMWEHFFSPTATVDERVATLEGGEAMRAAVVQRAADPLQAHASAKVANVAMVGADRAMVTYDVLLDATVALSAAQGFAVRDSGVWKVSAESFCALVSLGASAPIPGCA